MIKSEIVSKMAEKSGLTKKDAEAALVAFIETVEEGLIAGEKIQMIGFGTFEPKERAARVGRNPRKPEETIDIPASKSVGFKVGSKLKEKLNK